MLSEAEQRKLSEIESHLKAEDPTFVQRFNDRGQRRPRWRGLVALLEEVHRYPLANLKRRDHAVAKRRRPPR